MYALFLGMKKHLRIISLRYREVTKPNNEKEIRIYSGKLYKWQSDAAAYFLKFHRGLILTIKSRRQCGKSYFINMLALNTTINYKNRRFIVVSPTFSNGKKMWKELEKYFSILPQGILKRSSLTDLSFELSNGSFIQFKSIEQGAALRGDKAHVLVFDEAAFIDTEQAMSLCFPYVNTTQGAIIMVSTPKFKDENNLFYKFYKKGLEGKRMIKAIDWCKYDTSALLTEEQKAMYKETMPPNVYLNEIEGEFINAESELWNLEPVLQSPALPTTKNCAGLDWASGTNNDETVLSIFNQNKKMVALFRYKDVAPTEQVERIADLLKEYNVSKLTAEKNSIGEVYLSMLKRTISNQRIPCQVFEFDTNNKSKREIIEQLQVEIQNQTISLINDNALKLQFTMFEIKSTPTGKITYGNSSDKYHDDIVMSVAMALNNYKMAQYAIR